MYPTRKQFADNLAAALVGGEWRFAPARRRASGTLTRKGRWLKPLLERVFARFPDVPRDDQLSAFIERDERFLASWQRAPSEIKKRVPPPLRMWPPSTQLTGEPPTLVTTNDLAEWLGITPERLDWYADVLGINTQQRIEGFRQYTDSWVPKPGPNPTKKYRLIEAPKPSLKWFQRRILNGILSALPPHDAAHGFRTGRSIVTNAQVHCGRAVVLRFDLSDFFPSVTAARVRLIFRAVGYPQRVADLLTGLCTTRLPADVWDARPHPAPDGSDHATGVRLMQRHLPQGAPTSPALANLSAFGLDVRLAALANELGGSYTRYADDLTISGGANVSAAAHRIRRTVFGIAAEEGFAINPHKTRILRRGQRQRVAGVVVNVRPNVPRHEFDLLKAILTNCVRGGAAAQNRESVPDFRSHLAGRISLVAMVNPPRGRKLWAIFDRIEWPTLPPDRAA